MFGVFRWDSNGAPKLKFGIGEWRRISAIMHRHVDVILEKLGATSVHK